jgi:ADP-heptose:LPS heptosyltransferase
MPLAMALKRARPDLDLTWITQPESAPLLRGHPAVSRVEVFPRRAGLREQVRALRLLRRVPVDLLLDPQGNSKSALVSRFVRARRRLGLRLADATEWTNRLAHRECVAPYEKSAHVVDRYLSFAAHLGIADLGVDFGIRPTDGERAGAERLLAEAGLEPDRPVIALQVGSLEDARQWRADRMAETADRLAERSGYGAVVTAGPAHVADGREVAGRVRKARTLDTSGNVDLRGLVALYAALAERPGSLLLSGDTAPVHLAVAVGLRVVGLYGSQPPRRTGPYGGVADVVTRAEECSCVPCRERVCIRDAEPRACMERISVDEVLARIDRAHPRS